MTLPLGELTDELGVHRAVLGGPVYHRSPGLCGDEAVEGAMIVFFTVMATLLLIVPFVGAGLLAFLFERLERWIEKW